MVKECLKLCHFHFPQPFLCQCHCPVKMFETCFLPSTNDLTASFFTEFGQYLLDLQKILLNISEEYYSVIRSHNLKYPWKSKGCTWYLLFPICQRSKKWSIMGLPRSLHLFGHSSLIHFAIEACLSEMNDLIIIPDPSIKVNTFWNARNSIAVLLPAWLA